MELKLKESGQLWRLGFGFMFLSIGIYLTKISTLGMNSWSVFHEGIAINVSFLTFGRVTSIVGIMILTFSIIVLKTKVGIGTFLNILIIGPTVDLLEYLYPELPDVISFQVGVLVMGILFTAFGRSLYISAKLGPGPRDGLFVGLSAILNVKVKYVKITIEMIVLLIGYLLGGEVGFGTVIAIITSGYLVQFFFKVLNYDPNESIVRPKLINEQI